MARSKLSRKGKKEWRRNISTADNDEFLDRSGRDERSGGPLDGVSSDSLFFVDKAKDTPAKLRKVDRVRAKTLHSDSVLKRASMVPPVNWNGPRPKKALVADRKTLGAPGTQKQKTPVKAQGQQQQQQQLQKDLWEDEDLGGLKAGVLRPDEEKLRRKKHASKAPVDCPVVPAVEVDLPGCSYNPAFEEHQDALAVAVADEVVKENKKELEPVAPPLELVASGRAHTVVSETELYSGLEELLPEGVHPEEASREAGGEEGGSTPLEDEPGAPSKPVRVNKLTRADLNRRIRRREQEALLAAKLKRKKMNQDTDRVLEIAAELEDAEEEAERRRLRKEVARKEKRLEAPPRLGKHRFEPEPVNVLLTEEVTGSLRQVKGCFTLAKDRFKSLQKRGILEPRLPVKKKAAKRRRIVEVGTKGQKEREMHAEILQMRAIRQGKVLALDDQ